MTYVGKPFHKEECVCVQCEDWHRANGSWDEATSSAKIPDPKPLTSNWYSPAEIRVWQDAKELGLTIHADWLAAQLNLAYRKGQEHSGPLVSELRSENAALRSEVATANLALMHVRRALPDDGPGPMQDQIVEQWLVDTGWKRLPALNVFVKQFAHCRIEVWTPERDSGWCIYASDKIPTLLMKQATRSQLTKLVEALGGAQ